MPLTTLLVDLDGTLVDTNGLHTEAYLRTLPAFGFSVERDAIARQVGKGGDKLVPSLIGEDGERAHGEAIRKRAGDAFIHELAPQRGIPLFEGAEAFLREAKRLGLRLAIATSAGADDLEAIFAHAGTDLRPLVELVTTASDVDDSKPDPDIVRAALDRLGAEPGETALVGDTIYDAEAAGRAGVTMWGVAQWVWSEADLREAGAAHTRTTLAALTDDLPRLVESA